MCKNTYEQLADTLDRLPNGFPRTASGVELRILQKIFTPDEAELAGRLSGAFEPADSIAARLEMPLQELTERLTTMAQRGLVWMIPGRGMPRFRLAPFVVGIYEAQLERMDHELAHLVEEYLLNGGAAGIMGPEPALHRVVPANQALPAEWILPYDDVRQILQGAKSFRVRDCICRTQQQLIGAGCDFPLKVCLTFSAYPAPPGPDDISQAEALDLLARTEEIGLVHTVSNVMQGIGYVCNCCGCCCGILRGITEFGIENSVARSSYQAVIDPEACTGCLVCVERCQVGAIAAQDGVAAVDLARCIGCGLCVTGCPDGVARLERRPAADVVAPPADFAAWERARLASRGLAA